jgi:hypothetical protein
MTATASMTLLGSDRQSASLAGGWRRGGSFVALVGVLAVVGVLTNAEGLARMVASSEQRLQNIVAVSRKVVAPVRWDAYLFATGDSLQRSRFAEAEWRCLDGSSYGLLFTNDAEASSGSRTPDVR